VCAHLVWDEVLQPREDKNDSRELISHHDVIYFVDYLLKFWVVIFQLLPGNDVPEGIQDGYVEPENERDSPVLSGTIMVKILSLEGRCNAQHNDTQHHDIQHKSTWSN